MVFIQKKEHQNVGFPVLSQEKLKEALSLFQLIFKMHKRKAVQKGRVFLLIVLSVFSH